MIRGKNICQPVYKVAKISTVRSVRTATIGCFALTASGFIDFQTQTISENRYIREFCDIINSIGHAPFKIRILGNFGENYFNFFYNLDRFLIKMNQCILYSFFCSTQICNNLTL
jgi:hypothetical protein